MSRHPWSAVPARRSSEARLRVKLWALGGVVGLAVFAGPLGLVINATRRPPAVTLPPPAVNRDSALAQVVAQDYLDGISTPAPVAVGVSPALAVGSRRALPVTSLAFEGYSLETNTATGQRWQLNQFLVQSVGALYVLDVPTEDVHGLPVLGALPALMPAQMALNNQVRAVSSADPALPYGSSPPSLPARVSTAINTWASAFAQGNARVLLSLTGARSGRYLGLGGFRIPAGAPPTVVSAAWTDHSESTLLVRVAVVFDSTRANGFQTSNDYDLLVTNTTGENPNIVAWGPAGVSQLTPYGNNSELP